MYYDGPEMVRHYHEWLSANREIIDGKIADGLKETNPQQAVQSAVNILLSEVLPMAIAEMILFNNSRLEEKQDSGCSGCTVIK